jgi:hypothetical protein
MAAWADIPENIRTTILHTADRAVAEEKADMFAAVHDEMSDFRLKVRLNNNIQLTIYKATEYFDYEDIVDLWFMNRDADHKRQIELQIKAKALGLLRRHGRHRPRLPTFRIGNVLVQADRVDTLNALIGSEYFVALRRFRMGIFPPDYVFMTEY